MMFTTKPGHRSGVRVLKVKVRVEVRAIFKKTKQKKTQYTDAIWPWLDKHMLTIIDPNAKGKPKPMNKDNVIIEE